MASLHYHPDHLVYVRTDAGNYTATVADFDLDRTAAGLPALPALPDGLIEVYVSPDAGAAYAITADWSQVPAPEAWTAYAPLALAAYDHLVHAQVARMP